MRRLAPESMSGLLPFKYRFLIFRALIIVLFFGVKTEVYPQKNDTVYLMNGDRITGEFKKFDFGILTFSTDAMSTLSIEYDKIKTIYSEKNFEVVDVMGFSLFGTVAKAEEPGLLGIAITNDTVYTPVSQIVQVFPIKNIFWKKFSGSIDLGASYYKSTDIIQLNFSTDINYRARKRLVSLAISSIYSDEVAEKDNSISRKSDLSLELNQFFKGKWWAGAGVKVQQNSELNLDYRLQAGLVGGYDIVRTNPVWFYTAAGLMANQEKPMDTSEVTSSLEGIVSVKFIWIQYNHPKVNISTSFNFIPSLTVSDRYRMEYDLSAKYELFKDFYLGVSFYDSFDSKPASGGSSLNDWGTVLSIGYSF